MSDTTSQGVTDATGTAISNNGTLTSPNPSTIPKDAAATDAAAAMNGSATARASAEAGTRSEDTTVADGSTVMNSGTPVPAGMAALSPSNAEPTPPPAPPVTPPASSGGALDWLTNEVKAASTYFGERVQAAAHIAAWAFDRVQSVESDVTAWEAHNPALAVVLDQAMAYGKRIVSTSIGATPGGALVEALVPTVEMVVTELRSLAASSAPPSSTTSGSGSTATNAAQPGSPMYRPGMPSAPTDGADPHSAPQKAAAQAASA